MAGGGTRRDLVKGSVFVRPLILGLLVDRNEASVQRAMQTATSCWGGMYWPLLWADRPTEELENVARAFAVDTVVDDFADPDGRPEADVLWPSWPTKSPYGPFDGLGGYGCHRVQHVGPLLTHRMRMFETPGFTGVPTVIDGRPPDLIEVAQFGAYADDEVGALLRRRFIDGVHRLPSGTAPQSVQAPPSVTPIELTSAGLQHSGRDRKIGIAVVDRHDLSDLVAFWNLRASGHQVKVCPSDLEGQPQAALGNWLHMSVGEAHLQPSSHLAVWRRADVDMPSPISRTIDDLGWAQDVRPLDAPASMQAFDGSHPIAPRANRRFTIDLDDPPTTREVPLPVWDALRSDDEGGQVAAQFSISSSRFEPGGAAPSVPCAPGLARAYSWWATQLGGSVLRPGLDGPVVAVNTWQHEVVLPVLTADGVIGTLFPDSALEASSSDAGRFSTQIATMVGPAANRMASQPGARAVLRRLAASPDGAPLQRLIREAEDNAGEWNLEWFSREVQPGYGHWVVERLVDVGLVVPQLDLACPGCRNRSQWDLDDLRREIVCRLCGHAFRAGVALLRGPHHDARRWRYKLVSHMDYSLLSGALAVVATATVIDELCRLPSGGGDVCQYGVELRHGRSSVGDLDYFRLTSRYGVPTAYIAEVKAGGGSGGTKGSGSRIGDAQLEGLSKVQVALRRQGLECVIVAATMADRFEDDEVAALRRLIDRRPAPLYPASRSQCLPIVLCRAQLEARSHAAGLVPWLEALQDPAQVSIDLNLR